MNFLTIEIWFRDTMFNFISFITNYENSEKFCNVDLDKMKI